MWHEIGFWVSVVITSAVAIRQRGFIGFMVLVLMATVVVGREL